MVFQPRAQMVGRTLAVASIPVLLAAVQSLSLTHARQAAIRPIPALAGATRGLERLDQHLAIADEVPGPARTVPGSGVRAAVAVAALPRIEAQLTGSPLEVALVNVDRAQAGLPPLRQSALLTRVAQLRAIDMLTRSYFSHVDPATGSLAFLELFRSLQVAYRSAGENIAWSSSPSAETFNAWFMGSPDHRANLLSSSFHQVGVGLASAGGRSVIVEIFTD